MRHTIKQEVMMRVALIFFVVIVSGIITFSGMNNVRGYIRSTEEANKLHSLVLSAEKAHYGWVENLCSAIAMGTEFTGSKDYKTCVLGKWFYDSDLSTIDNAEIHQLIEEMKPIHQAIHESAQIILDMNQTDPEEAKRLYLEDTKVNVDQLVAILDKVGAITEAQVRENQSGLLKAVSGTEAISLGSIAITLIVCILLVLYVMSRIIRPLQTITESSRNLSEGNLDFHIDVNSSNEIGVLADSLNTSVKNLKLYISDISMVLDEIAAGNLGKESAIQYIGDFVQIQKAIETISDQFCNTMEQIHSSSSQVDSGANQVAVGAQSLAQGATEQASEVDNLLQMIEQVTEQINENTKSAAITTKEADNVGEKITICSDQMQKMADAMQQISSCSGEIQHIIKTIEDIAFQTNILALNAAVEAARAGSAGKGFAVVADEVRNLASKSDEAAKATKDLIESSVQSVENGNKIVNEVTGALHRTTELAGLAVADMVKVAGMVEAAVVSISQVTEGLDQISAVVQTNSATSEESAAASEELSSQAQLLNDLVSQFQLPDNHCSSYMWQEQ